MDWKLRAKKLKIVFLTVFFALKKPETPVPAKIIRRIANFEARACFSPPVTVAFPTLINVLSFHLQQVVEGK